MNSSAGLYTQNGRGNRLQLLRGGLWTLELVPIYEPIKPDAHSCDNGLLPAIMDAHEKELAGSVRSPLVLY